MTTAQSSSITTLAIRSPIFRKNEDLVQYIVSALATAPLMERDILAVTSKIVSLAENRLVKRTSISKQALVQREADRYLGDIGNGCHLTIKENLLIPSAGIDESNSEHDDYILYPENPLASAQSLHAKLRAHFQLNEFGVILTDSHVMPLRQGVIGVGLAHAGFNAVRNLIGEPDIFGRKLQMTKMNYVDGLSASAVLLMGEADECRPLALIRGAPVEFNQPEFNQQSAQNDEIRMPLERDLFYPLLRPFLGK